ncbi:MAG: hypothetical protein HHAS10_07010 [Candidatus Altimarinota bacterium]
MQYNIPPCFYRLSVKALIHNSDGKFLLIKEENGLWELPGGGLDYGEELQECLRREIYEEMGLETVKIASEPCYFYTSTNLSKSKHIVNALYETSVKNLEFTPSEECVEIGFFTLQEASTLDTYPNIKEFLKHYNPSRHVHV